MGVQLGRDHGVVLFPHPRQLGEQRGHVRHGLRRPRGPRGALEQTTRGGRRQVGEQDPAHGGEERRQPRADVEVHPDDPLGVHAGDAELRGEGLQLVAALRPAADRGQLEPGDIAGVGKEVGDDLARARRAFRRSLRAGPVRDVMRGAVVAAVAGLVLILGPGYAVIYYVVFRTSIRMFNLKTPGREIERHYPTMTHEDICAIPVPAARNAVLYLWAVAPKLPDALEVMTSWGFKYKTSAVWDARRPCFLTMARDT